MSAFPPSDPWEQRRLMNEELFKQIQLFDTSHLEVQSSEKSEPLKEAILRLEDALYELEQPIDSDGLAVAVTHIEEALELLRKNG